jgi:protein SCO1/2
MKRVLSILPNARAAIAAAVVAWMAAGACAERAVAQLNLAVPEELKGVDIVERLDADLPLDARFTDDLGRQVSLRDYFDGKRPVLLQLGYNRCPMLCNLVLNGAVNGLKGVDWNAGDQFDLVSISVAPTETPELAKVKKDGYVLEYGRDGATRGFRFLTGPAASSHAVADAVGFRFREQENGEIAHAAVLFVLTPEGRVSRYLYGTKFDPKDLRLALLEASEGKIGTTLDRFILWCHVYDPDARGYVLFAVRLMQLGGLVTLVVLGAGLFWLFRSGSRPADRNSTSSPTSSEPPARTAAPG